MAAVVGWDASVRVWTAGVQQLRSDLSSRPCRSYEINVVINVHYEYEYLIM